MARKTIPDSTQVSILKNSARRCCLCWGLKGDFTIKKGQLAHVDQDNANNSEDNLCFLCIECHDAYDSVPRQSKGLTADELKSYRQDLYRFVERMRELWQWSVSYHPEQVGQVV